jgi:hypothetical protein
MKIDGGCYCGQLIFVAEINPDNVIICHCTDCQTLSGAAYRTVAPAIEGSFRFTSGVPKTFVKTAQSGARRVLAFCPECATPIYSAPENSDSSFFGIRVGSIRQRDQLVPKAQYYCRSQQTWVDDLSTIPKA